MDVAGRTVYHRAKVKSEQMVDSPKISDSSSEPQGSVGNFGDLAQRIMDGQIASRRQNGTSGNGDNSAATNQSPTPDLASNLPWQSRPFEPQANSNQWQPLQIAPPAWSPSSGWPASPQNPALDLQRIGTLRANQPASQGDGTIYHTNSDEAKLFNANRDSVVRVFGHAKGQPIDREYTGSGFFVSDHGDIATASHVINDLDSIRVTTSDGVEHAATVVSNRPTADVAIIHIDTNEKTQPVALAETSNLLRKGEQLYTIGHPSGWRKEYLSPGYFVSSDTTRDISGEDIEKQNPHHILLTTNQNLVGGDSGAPTFDANGKVVGVVSRSDLGRHGYSVPVDDLWPLMDKVAAPKQTTSVKQSDIPSKLHFGPDEVYYSAVSAVNLTSMATNAPLVRGVGIGTRLIAAPFAGLQLVNQDLPFFENAFANGTTREKVSAAAEVGGDALLIGGSLMTIVPRFRAAAPAVSLAGSMLKLGNGMAAFRTYW